MFEPEFVCLVGDDEEVFIMNLSPVHLGLRLLSLEQFVQLQIIPVRNSSWRVMVDEEE